MLKKCNEYKQFFIACLFILLNNAHATPLRKLISESENIIVGLVIKTETIKGHYHNSKATIKIDTIVKGEIKKSTIEVYFCSKGLYSPPCEYLTLSQNVLLFLNKSDSIYSLKSHFGVISLDNKTKVLYLEQVGRYLKIEKQKKNKLQIIEWLISGISLSTEFSYLCNDLFEYKNDLTPEQKQVLLRIFYNSDTIFRSSFFQNNNPYLVLDYFQIASIIGRTYSIEITAFLLQKLNESTSSYLTRNIMKEIYFINKSKKLKELLTQYDKIQFYNNSDSIEEESKLIVKKFSSLIDNVK